MHHTDKQSCHILFTGDALFTRALQKRLAANRFPTTLSLCCRSLVAPPPAMAEQENKLPLQLLPDTFNIN
jgi:hypothetical protein